MCAGRKSLQPNAEEEQFADLLNLIDLLTNLLDHDFVESAPVVLYGLGIVVPLMSAEFLKVSSHSSYL